MNTVLGGRGVTDHRGTGRSCGSISAALLNLPDRLEPCQLIAAAALTAVGTNVLLLSAHGLAIRLRRTQPYFDPASRQTVHWPAYLAHRKAELEAENQSQD